MNILLGLDDSPHAEITVRAVLGMCWPLRSRVTVLSCAPPQAQPASEIPKPPASFHARLQEEIARTRQYLVDCAERRLRACGLEVEIEVALGDPRLVLVDAARERKVDLLVVGSHGRTGVSKLLMGSVATHVVTHAPCTVMVVKGKRAP
jgi:nucleotide-binding universal stress UspA family protein